MADIAASVLAKLRNKAKASGISYQQCLQLFVQEAIELSRVNEATTYGISIFSFLLCLDRLNNYAPSPFVCHIRKTFLGLGSTASWKCTGS